MPASTLLSNGPPVLLQRGFILGDGSLVAQSLVAGKICLFLLSFPTVVEAIRPILTQVSPIPGKILPVLGYIVRLRPRRDGNGQREC
jgi:hypothetical protein